MKLRQREFCHNCNQYVEFEFDDTTDRQVIYCPNCGHEHYRELDEGTITQFRINPACREVRFLKPQKMTAWMDSGDGISLEPVNLDIETREVLGNRDGFAILKPKEGEQTKKIISQRRWGRDPRQ